MPLELTRDAVDQSVKEYQALGGPAFRKKYGFGGARDYFLTIEGENYDSKAIVGAAYQHIPGGKALGPYDLSGGAADAAGKLIALGYQVTTPGQNADWSWDEHVLALEFYHQHRLQIPGKKSAEIGLLSKTLIALGHRTKVAMTPKFRNENGVYMKMMNFRRVDPDFTSLGKSGLAQGAQLEARVWEFYEDKPQLLASHAAAIRFALDNEHIVLHVNEDSPEYEGEEGGVLLKLHFSRERDSKLIRKKKSKVLETKGALACEVCALDFSQRYGAHGQGYIEVHHLKPVSTLAKITRTKLSDLALVCANCHRMLHRGKVLLRISDLKATLR